MAFCAFVAFNNLSLQYNGVSFYQLMKILTTPAVVVLQLVFFKVLRVLSPTPGRFAGSFLSGQRVRMHIHVDTKVLNGEV